MPAGLMLLKEPLACEQSHLQLSQLAESKLHMG